MSVREFPTQQVLELACAAQRINGAYIKEDAPVYSEDGAFMYLKLTNKIQMLCTLDPAYWTSDPKLAPMPLRVLPEDTAQADSIRLYYKRLLFSAIEGDNEFLTTINSILSSETVKSNQLGYVACLPSVCARDQIQNKIKKAARQVDEGYLADIGSSIKDLDAEIIASIKSKNFEGYNIDAIISNKMVSWLNKTNLDLGPCVVVKAKVKDHNKHWKHQNDVTRLNFVKAAQ
jgi:hypothetical protein